MFEISTEYKPILMEALTDLMYKLSLQLDELKGGPLDKTRKELTRKQLLLEELQHKILTQKS